MINDKYYKYWVSINQKAYTDNHIKISFELAALLSYLIDICSSTNPKIEAQRLDGYTWVNFGKLLKDMPLLKGRSAASITGNLNKLEALKLIETKNSTVNGRPRKYIRKTELCNIIINAIYSETNKEVFTLLISLGMNVGQAEEIASWEEFLKDNIKIIRRTAKSSCIANKPGYIWETFNRWRSS
ncbi:MAG: hypothetical protein WC582_00890 [Patescibacteria group bacterium]